GIRNRCQRRARHAAAAARADRSTARRCTAARWSGRCRSAAGGCGTPAPPAQREPGGGAPPWRARRAPRATCWRGRFPRASRRTGRPPRRPCSPARTKNPENGFLQPIETPAAGVSTRAFILLDKRVRVVVVDRLEVLGFHHVRLDALVQVE